MIATGPLGVSVNSSYPSAADGTGAYGNTGWAAFANNETAEDQLMQAYAICAQAATVSPDPTQRISK